VPHLAELTDALAARLGVRVGLNLYASWKADDGLALHWDTHGVIVLQLAGRKQWTVHHPSRPDPVKDDAFEPPAADAEPAWSGMLEDGDMLYLPRGYPHVASAVDGASMHLTISLSEPTGVTFLKWLAPLLRDVPQIRASLPRAGDTAAEAAWLETMREMIGAHLTPEVLASYRTEQAASMPMRPRFALPELQRAQPGTWNASTQLRLPGDPAIRLLRTPGGGRKALFGGQRWACSDATARALGRLSGDEWTRLEDIEEGLDLRDRGELRRILALMLVAGALFARTPEA
jgi:hypothetical protein